MAAQFQKNSEALAAAGAASQAKYAEMQKNIDAEVKAIPDIKVNSPFTNGTTGQKIMAGIAIALGGIGGALTGKGDNKALDVINKAIEQDLDVMFVPLVTYYKDLEHSFEDSYYVSLFYKITKNKQYTLAYPTPVTIDPTRSSSGDKYLIAERSLIEMHHLSYVRTQSEMVMKLNNSSARVNYNNEINSLLEYYNEFETGMKAYVAGNPCKFIKLTKIENKFKHLQ